MKKLTSDDRKRLDALRLAVDELSSKLNDLTNRTDHSPHYEDMQLDTCEQLAELISQRIKKLRGTDKTYRATERNQRPTRREIPAARSVDPGPYSPGTK